MALQAELVHLGPGQQMRIGRAMGRVASHAALDLYRRMLVLERSSFVGMAIEANCLLRSRGSKLMSLRRAVRIVAITALHKSFVYTVMGRLGKIRFHFTVAAITKLRLRRGQQVVFYVGRVLGVATRAPHIILHMLGAQVVTVGFVSLMAGKAALGSFLGRKLLKINDLGGISSAIHMRFTRPMAALAPLPLRTFMRRLRGLPMGAALVAVALRLMTSLAGVRSNVLRDVGRGPAR
jgi:hypothetical protein